MNTTQRKDLGVFDTVIVGTKYHDGKARAGDTILLQREPDNKYDRNAVLCISADREEVGYLPRRIVKWLAPLMDDRKVELVAIVTNSNMKRPDLLGLGISVTWCGADMETMPRDLYMALHGIVRGVLDSAASMANPSDIETLGEKLWSLDDKKLLPETYLMLHLFPGVAKRVQRERRTDALAQCRAAIESLHLGQPQSFGNIAFYPILGTSSKAPNYDILSDAIQGGVAEICEVNEHGDVGNLKVINKGHLPLFIPEGEMLVGAKQNRVVNISVMVAAKSETIIPVSCVEEGRWHHVSETFEAAQFAPMELRRRKMQAVSESRRNEGSARGDQDAVWDDVRSCLDSAKAESDTSSIFAAYEERRERLEECRRSITMPEGTVGFLASIDGVIKGVEVFDSPATLTKLWDRLSDGYMLQAVAHEKSDAAPATVETVREFIKNLDQSVELTEENVGIGQGIDIDTPDISGTGLNYDGRLVHLAAFSGN